MEKFRLAILSAVVVSTILGSAFLLGLVRPASSGPTPAPTFEYRAKWICNAPTGNLTFAVIDTASAEKVGLVPGEYKTDINVHNPSHSVNLTIFKKFVVSSPEMQQRFGPIASAKTTLTPDGAFFIDCRDIFSIYRRAGIFLCPSFGNVTCAAKGFVVLDQVSPGTLTGISGFSSANSLDVVGEYSSESFAPTASTSPASDFCLFANTSGPCVSTGTSLDVVPIPASPFVA